MEWSLAASDGAIKRTDFKWTEDIWQQTFSSRHWDAGRDPKQLLRCEN